MTQIKVVDLGVRLIIGLQKCNLQDQLEVLNKLDILRGTDLATLLESF